MRVAFELEIISLCKKNQIVDLFLRASCSKRSLALKPENYSEMCSSLWWTQPCVFVGVNFLIEALERPRDNKQDLEIINKSTFARFQFQYLWNVFQILKRIVSYEFCLPLFFNPPPSFFCRHFFERNQELNMPRMFVRRFIFVRKNENKPTLNVSCVHSTFIL